MNPGAVPGSVTGVPQVFPEIPVGSPVSAVNCFFGQPPGEAARKSESRNVRRGEGSEFRIRCPAQEKRRLLLLPLYRVLRFGLPSRRNAPARCSETADEDGSDDLQSRTVSGRTDRIEGTDHLHTPPDAVSSDNNGVRL